MPRKPAHEPVSEKKRGEQKLALTPEQVEKLGRLREKGATFVDLAKKFGVMRATVTRHYHRWAEKQEAKKFRPVQANPQAPTLTASRPATAHLKGVAPFTGKPVNPSLSAQSPTNGPPVEAFDPLITQLVNNPMISDGKEQSYRDNLSWACQAAGQKLRTGNRPSSCPNDKAFFLYKLACENPKDFMTKFSQVETKEREDADVRKEKKSTQFLLDEVETQLSILEME